MPIKKKKKRLKKSSKALKGTSKFEELMDVTKVACSYGMTLNLGNYESMRADATTTVEAKPPETLSADDKELLKDSMFDKAWKECRKQLRIQVEAIRKENKPGKS